MQNDNGTGKLYKAKQSPERIKED